ncbi:MAG: hypothetical protein GF401_12760 [Chitinivibrionales bacterium]|nr:hypothetical protein [Chitinivibrionales bacterium]
MKLLKICLIATIGLSLISMKCKEEDPTGPEVIKCSGTCPDVSEITVLCPNGGETYSVGDYVQVQFCIPDNWPYNQARLFFSNNGGIDWIEIGTEGESDGYPVDIPNNTYTWKITSEYAGSECFIRATDYDATVQDFSDAPFVINE